MHYICIDNKPILPKLCGPSLPAHKVVVSSKARKHTNCRSSLATKPGTLSSDVFMRILIYHGNVCVGVDIFRFELYFATHALFLRKIEVMRSAKIVNKHFSMFVEFDRTLPRCS